MIKGLGSDIIEISRIKRLIDRYGERFLERFFTEKECIYCKKYSDYERRFAGRFAAKEAVSKALGTGFRGSILLHTIEILPDAQGKPLVHLPSHVNDELHHPILQVTISHCKEYALAVAIWDS